MDHKQFEAIKTDLHQVASTLADEQSQRTAELEQFISCRRDDLRFSAKVRHDFVKSREHIDAVLDSHDRAFAAFQNLLEEQLKFAQQQLDAMTNPNGVIADVTQS